jgi:Domain of unknown function (DUF4145)
MAFQAWVLYECVTCGRPTLKDEWWHDGYEEGGSNTLLPTTDRDYSTLPPAVAKAYEAARAVQRVEPNAYAVLVGRTLEVICLEEGAKGRNLVERLHDLVASGRIPGLLADMAQQLRQIRNLGAHAATDEVRAEDVPVIFDFAEAIIEYLYRAPAKVAAVQARLTP